MLPVGVLCPCHIIYEHCCFLRITLQKLSVNTSHLKLQLFSHGLGRLLCKVYLVGMNYLLNSANIFITSNKKYRCLTNPSHSNYFRIPLAPAPSSPVDPVLCFRCITETKCFSKALIVQYLFASHLVSVLQTAVIGFMFLYYIGN